MVRKTKHNNDEAVEHKARDDDGEGRSSISSRRKGQEEEDTSEQIEGK